MTRYEQQLLEHTVQALEAIERPRVRWERAKPCCIYCGAPDVDGFFAVVTDRMTGNDVVICEECK